MRTMLEASFHRIKSNAERYGMKVNAQKTQLLCTSTAINYDVRAYIEVEGTVITSRDTLTTVGYTMGRRPGPYQHIKQIRRKYGARAGILRHLKKIGIDAPSLVQIYTSLIRLVFEYSCVAFHTCLTADLSEALERLQRISLKTIFGLEKMYE